MMSESPVAKIGEDKNLLWTLTGKENETKSRFDATIQKQVDARDKLIHDSETE